MLRGKCVNECLEDETPMIRTPIRRVPIRKVLLVRHPRLCVDRERLVRRRQIRVCSRSPPRNQGLSPLGQRAPVSALPKIPKWFPIPRSVRPDGTHLQPVPSRAVQPPKGFNLELAWDINSDTLCWKPVPEGEQVCEKWLLRWSFVEVET